MTYESLASFAQQGGSLYFLALFAVICVYAFWPKNKEKFDKAAALPLDDENDDAPRVTGHQSVEN